MPRVELPGPPLLHPATIKAMEEAEALKRARDAATGDAILTLQMRGYDRRPNE